jgi:TetR/AcrR family transcriptional regulator, cholesterol catabolism regulator
MRLPHENEAFAGFSGRGERTTVRLDDRLIGRRFGMAIEARYEGILGAARDVIARRGFHQASIREIASASGLSLAGLYHYVGGKDELLFLILDRALDRLVGTLEVAWRDAGSPEARLRALVETHLDFASRDPHALKIINRDHDALAEPHRAEVAAKRQQYLHHGLAVLRELDRYGRSEEELLSATNLLLGMLNGLATRPFIRSDRNARALAATVTNLFLHGFLGTGSEDGRHDPEPVELAPGAGGAGRAGGAHRI